LRGTKMDLTRALSRISHLSCFAVELTPQASILGGRKPNLWFAF
jgi:hypothetical protein